MGRCPWPAAVIALATAASLARAHASGGAACEGLADCSYNGECTAPAGVCDCDQAWTGPACARLNLLPATRGGGLNTSDTGGAISSWGGTVNKGDDGRFHMHVAQFVKHCGFNQWATNSRVRGRCQ